MADHDNNGSIWPFSNAATGALAVGTVGLLAAYQPWGRRASQFLGRIAYTTNQTFLSKHSTASSIGKDIGQYTKTDYSQLWNSIKKHWQHSDNVTKTVSLGVSNRGSDTWGFGTLLKNVIAAEHNSRAMVHDQWKRIRVYGSDYIQDRLKDPRFNQNTQKSLNKFAQDVLKNATAVQSNMLLAKRFNFESESLRAAHEIINYTNDVVSATRARDKSAFDDSKFLDDMTHKAKEVLRKQALSIDSLERNLGTVDPNKFFMGSRRLAVRDLLKLKQKANNNIRDHAFIVGLDHSGNEIQGTVLSEIEKLQRRFQKGDKETYERFLNLAVDYENLYVTKEGNAYSKEQSGAIWRGALSSIRSTLPGKLFKVGDIENNYRIETVQFMSANTRDPIFTSMLKEKGLDKLDQGFLRVGKDLYGIDSASGNSTYLGAYKWISGRYGFYHSHIEAMAGESRMKEADNTFFRMLDVFQDRETYTGHAFQDFTSKFRKGLSDRGQKFYGLLERSPEQQEEFDIAMQELNQYFSGAYTSAPLSDETYSFLSDYLKTAKDVSQLFRSNTYIIPKRALNVMENTAGITNDTKELIHFLRGQGHGDIDTLVETLTHTSAAKTPWLNPQLDALLKKYEKQPDRALNSIELATNEMRLSYSSDITELHHSGMGNETYFFEDVLRREVSKEALLRQGYDAQLHPSDSLDYDKILDYIDNSELTTRERKEAHKLLHSAFFDRETYANAPVDEATFAGDVMARLEKTESIMSGHGPGSHVSEAMLQDFRKTYKTVLNDEISLFESSLETDVAGTGSLNSTIMINNSVSPLDIVKAINEDYMASTSVFDQSSATRAALKNVWEGLSADREHMSQYNLYTQIPFFMAKRLSDELNKVGLGFSSDSMSSSWDIWQSIVTKRVIPVGIGLTYFDWLSDTSREVTGTGIDQAFVSGVANVDLAGRKVATALGMDDWLKGAKAVNPIWQYWGDKDEYQGYEERQEYYQKGYTPVRKAAWLKMVCQVKIAELSRKAKFFIKRIR